MRKIVMCLATAVMTAILTFGFAFCTYADQKCDITCKYSELGGTVKASFAISNVTPGANAYITYQDLAALITEVTKQTSGNTYGVDNFQTVVIFLGSYEEDNPLEVDAANKRVAVIRAFDAPDDALFIKVTMKNEDFAAYISVASKTHDETDRKHRSKKVQRHGDDDEEAASPAPGVEPVNPNAISGSSFTGAGIPSGIVKIGPQTQGTAAQLTFRINTPAGWKEAFTFNMTVNDKVDYTLKQGTLSFYIPTQYLKPGRKYAILGLDKNGKVKVFTDIDNVPGTITANIDLEGYAFDLIYCD